MSITTIVRSVPRGLLDAGLSTARLPLTVAARAGRQQDNEQWPPAVAFEGLQAGVDLVVGSLLRDDELTERGRLRQARVGQLRRAARLETLAEQERAEADQRLNEREAAVEQQRERAATAARRREQQVEQVAQERARRTEQAAAGKAAAARRTKAAQDEALAREERQAALSALGEEAEALAAQQEAVEAQQTVESIDDAIEGSKADRATG